MATIPANVTPVIQALRRDPAGWAALRAESPSKQQLRSLVQGMENFFEANRAAMKAAMEAEAGITITQAFARKIGRAWMQLKFGGE